MDETSYKRGFKYITVVIDMDRNQVAWVHEDHGDEVFSLFCEQLTDEERDRIEIVAGDGAKWIDRCTDKYFKNAKRCIDPFHAVGWVTEAVDSVRRSAWASAENDLKAAAKQQKLDEEEVRKLRRELNDARKRLASMPRKRGRASRERLSLMKRIEELAVKLGEYENPPERIITGEEYRAARAELETMPRRGRRSARKIELLTIVSIYECSDESFKRLSNDRQQLVKYLEKQAAEIKRSRYALLKNPENLTAFQQEKLALIEASYPDMYVAYQLKEEFRAIFKQSDAGFASQMIDIWIEKAKLCGLPAFRSLSEKIACRKEGILNTIRYHANSAKSEATNTTIKALIASARGFRNLDNAFALIYLRCSDLVIPLNNRYRPSREKIQVLREIQAQRKKEREFRKTQQLHIGAVSA